MNTAATRFVGRAYSVDNRQVIAVEASSEGVVISTADQHSVCGRFVLSVDQAGRLIESIEGARTTSRLMAEGTEDKWKEKLSP